MHMIPRHTGDGVGLGWKMGELTEEDKNDILSKIKKNKEAKDKQVSVESIGKGPLM